MKKTYYKDLQKQKKKKKKRSGLLKALVAILVILLLLVGAAAFAVMHYYGMTDYEGDQTQSEADPEYIDAMVDDTGLTDSEAEDLLNQMNTDVTLPSNSNVYNLLLVGVDRRDTSWNGNSDSMILISINKETKKIHMISFMRDLYANIEGHGVRKLNAACAYGGLPLLVSTIQSNYGVPIDNYAWVDFNSMIDIVDAIGGVELTLSDAEAQSANGSVQEMCNLRNVDPTPHLFASGGTFNCDGYQAVAYGRIRHVGNSDYQRTERQRTVMTKIMQKARGMSITELNSFANQVLPLVHHDISGGDLVSLLASAPSVLGYDVEQDRVPYDGMFTVQKEILVPDMQATIQKLQQTLYG